MPYQYARDDTARRIRITLTDPLTVAERIAAVEQQVADDAWRYATLIDARYLAVQARTHPARLRRAHAAAYADDSRDVSEEACAEKAADRNRSSPHRQGKNPQAQLAAQAATSPDGQGEPRQTVAGLIVSVLGVDLAIQLAKV